MILYFIIISVLYLPIKLVLYFLVSKFGKFSYDGFSAAGFKYNSEDDLFYTAKYAWQRNFGYCHLYDVGAPIFRMIIDTEPVRFYYNNKNWLLTFWKGQYGIVTGAEVGIYYTNEKIIDKKTLYLPAKNKDLLDIDFTLYKNGEEIAKAHDKHWWLAIFKLGMFSKPKELTMDIKIEFPDEKMLNAFLRSFKKLKHNKKSYQVDGKTFKFIYKKPKTHKVWTRSFILDKVRQHYNKKNAIIYNKYLADLIDDDMIDDSIIETNEKLIMVKDMIPDIIKNKEEDIKRNNIFLNDNVFSSMRNKNE